LEKNFKEDLDKTEAKKLCLRSLLQVVESGSKNIEIWVLEAEEPENPQVLPSAELEDLFAVIKKEDDEAERLKKIAANQ